MLSLQSAVYFKVGDHFICMVIILGAYLFRTRIFGCKTGLCFYIVRVYGLLEAWVSSWCVMHAVDDVTCVAGSLAQRQLSLAHY